MTLFCQGDWWTHHMAAAKVAKPARVDRREKLQRERVDGREGPARQHHRMSLRQHLKHEGNEGQPIREPGTCHGHGAPHSTAGTGLGTTAARQQQEQEQAYAILGFIGVPDAPDADLHL